MALDTSSDDFIVWPDGVWCYRSELAGYGYKSDDYQVLYYDSDEWHTFNGANNDL